MLRALRAATPRNLLPSGRLFARRLKCSFCGRGADEVRRLVSGPSVYICDTCIAACVDVLKAHAGDEPDGTAH